MIIIAWVEMGKENHLMPHCQQNLSLGGELVLNEINKFLFATQHVCYIHGVYCFLFDDTVFMMFEQNA